MNECMLCPKRGGAMKPTNIFRSEEKFHKQKIQNIQNKKVHKLCDKQILNQQSQPTEQIEGEHHLSKSAIQRRLEPNYSLDQLLTREYLYQEELRYEYNQIVEKAKEDGVEPDLESEQLQTFHK